MGTCLASEDSTQNIIAYDLFTSILESQCVNKIQSVIPDCINKILLTLNSTDVNLQFTAASCLSKICEFHADVP